METLRKNPGFAALAVLLLALGFGAFGATAILDKALFMDELPYKDASRLLLLEGTFQEKEGEVQAWGISWIDFLDWRREVRHFEQMAAFSPGEMAFNLVVGDQAERLSGELVSYNYFSVLGVPLGLGRTFTPEEDGEPFKHPVVILSHGLWQRLFDGDRQVLGRSLNLNGEEYKVVGVAAEGFRGLSDKADAWIPSSMPPGPVFVSSRRMRWLGVVARLKPEATLEQAQEDLSRITGAMEKKFPESNQGMGVRAKPLAESWIGDLQSGLRPLTVVAFLLLLFACLSVAALLCARLRNEPALKPGLLLSLLGAVAGLALASWAIRALMPVSGFTFPSFIQPSAGPAVIAAVLALAVACGLLIWWLGRGRTAGRGWQSLSVVAQVGLAVILAVTAGLMAKGYGRVVSQELGFEPGNIQTVRVDLQGNRYKTDHQVIAIVRQYMERVARLPGVEGWAIAGPTVPTDPWAGGYITIEDHDSDLPGGIYPIMTHSITPDYFKVLGVPILQGRAFTLADAGEPASPFNVIVSKAMADQQWPGESPLGKRLKFSTRANPDHPWLTVVGVAANVLQQGLFADERPAPDLYLPILISPIRLPTTINILAVPKAGVAPASLVASLEREIRAATPDSPPYDAASLRERLERQTRKGRFLVDLAVFSAALALLLAAVSVYGAVAGGAARSLRDAALLSGIGVILGVVGIFVLSRRLTGLLHGVSAADPLVLAGMAALVFVLVLAAGVLAARRQDAGEEISRPDRPAFRDRAAL
jgi:hypothetical protein